MVRRASVATPSRSSSASRRFERRQRRRSAFLSRIARGAIRGGVTPDECMALGYIVRIGDERARLLVEGAAKTYRAASDPDALRELADAGIAPDDGAARLRDLARALMTQAETLAKAQRIFGPLRAIFRDESLADLRAASDRVTGAARRTPTRR